MISYNGYELRRYRARANHLQKQVNALMHLVLLFACIAAFGAGAIIQTLSAKEILLGGGVVILMFIFLELCTFITKKL